MSSLLDFEYSPWLVILCLLLAIGYSYIQYQKKTPWSANINKVLAGSRVVLVFFLAILLLGPVVRVVKNVYEKPLIVFAIDNSESISLATDSLALAEVISNLAQLKQNLISDGWDVQAVDLSGTNISLDSIVFDGQRSDLTRMIKSVQSEHSTANLNGIIMMTDGIFNSGFSPDFISKFTPIYSIGVGDSVPRKDLSIINIRHNKTVYQGNKFPVEVSIRNEGLGPASVNIQLFLNNTLQEIQQLLVREDTRLITHNFIVTANDPGKQRITIHLDSIPGESTTINNNASFYIDVIEGQQKILILADAPSPEIKAVRLAIGKNEHFTVKVVIGEEVDSLNYDLIVLLPNQGKARISAAYKQVVGSSVPLLILVGSSTNLLQLNKDGIAAIQQSGNQYDQVSATQNPDFREFTLSSDMDDWLSNAPPVTVPFANISLEPTDQVLLFQKVGSVTTNRPIIYLSKTDRKKGIIIGDGIWRWRLNEYLQHAETRKFDELIGKIVMYLAARPDNRQFKLYPAKNGFEVGEDVSFISETYNQLFEPLFGEQIFLKISKEDNTSEFSFTPLAGSLKLSIGQLTEGLYTYTAYTSLNGKQHRASGEFVVDKPNIEAADLTADYFGMRKLANATGGKFYQSGDIEELKNYFKENQTSSIIHSSEKEILLLDLYWILIALIVLITVEWLTRKMMGGY